MYKFDPDEVCVPEEKYVCYFCKIIFEFVYELLTSLPLSSLLLEASSEITVLEF